MQDIRFSTKVITAFLAVIYIITFYISCTASGGLYHDYHGIITIKSGIGGIVQIGFNLSLFVMLFIHTDRWWNPFRAWLDQLDK